AHESEGATMPYDVPMSDHAFRRSLERSRARRAATARRSWARFRARSGAIVLIVATTGLTGGAVAHDPPTQVASGHDGGEARAQAADDVGAPASGADAGGASASPALEAIAACESGGDPSAVSADGAYRGKYQFSYETWAAMGASGDPAAASEAEQDRRAAALMAQAGTSPWPGCA
ncbi:MAG: transglycosylase family protein, partial [Solirubrobacteraceae bacterium]